MHQYESATGIHVSSSSWTPLSPTQSLQVVRAPALGALLHTSNLPWLSILHTVTHIFQCYALKSSHPFLLEKTLESPLDRKEITPVNPKGIYIGRTYAEAELPILWPPDAKSWLVGKDPDGGKDWQLEEKGVTEDEMIGWHHRLNGHELEQAPGDNEGKGSLACWGPWGQTGLRN